MLGPTPAAAPGLANLLRRQRWPGPDSPQAQRCDQHPQLLTPAQGQSAVAGEFRHQAGNVEDGVHVPVDVEVPADVGTTQTQLVRLPDQSAQRPAPPQHDHRARTRWPPLTAIPTAKTDRQLGTDQSRQQRREPLSRSRHARTVYPAWATNTPRSSGNPAGRLRRPQGCTPRPHQLVPNFHRRVRGPHRETGGVHCRPHLIRITRPCPGLGLEHRSLRPAARPRRREHHPLKRTSSDDLIRPPRRADHRVHRPCRRVHTPARSLARRCRQRSSVIAFWVGRCAVGGPVGAAPRRAAAPP